MTKPGLIDAVFDTLHDREAMAIQQPCIVLAEPFEPAAVAKLRAVGQVTELKACDEATLRAAVDNCDALLVRSRARVTRAVIEGAPRLRVIGRGGVGLENIDVDAAKERGVIVVYTPGAATDAVADLTIGLMIAVVRGIAACDADVRAGRFEQARQRTCGRELSEMTVGIIGMGRIGRAVAKRCRIAFSMSVLYNDIVQPGWLGFVAEPATKDELYARCDVVSLHVPLNDTTKNLIDAGAFSRFKTGSFLINTSRGGVVGSEALAKALMDGHLAGAGLDVVEPEPLPADHPLLRAPNTIFTAHIGARTTSGLSRMNAVVDDVLRVLEGKPPLYPS